MRSSDSHESEPAIARRRIRDFWQGESCGECSALGESEEEQLESQAIERYLRNCSRFDDARGLDVLEAGVGRGADHAEFAEASPRGLVGFDTTARAIAFTPSRLGLFAIESNSNVDDAEAPPFPDGCFDLVWWWGDIHHAAKPDDAVKETLRVLRPSGAARVRVYHRNGLFLPLVWLCFSLLAGKPWRTIDDVISADVESPGTRVYTRAEAALFDGFTSVDCRSVPTTGEMLEGPIGRPHGRNDFETLERVFPHPLIRLLSTRVRSDLLIEAVR